MKQCGQALDLVGGAASDSVGQPAATGLNDLPPEVLLERVLPILGIKELLALSSTSNFLHSICNDESHWLHRTRLTFSYNPHTLAPATPGSGWSKRLYIGLSRPEPFVWGSADNDRLGLPERRGPGGGRIINHSRKVNRPQSLAGSFKNREEGGSRTWIERLGADLRIGHDLEEGKKGEKGIVEMHAGGWSFAARDKDGIVWVWGQLDGDLPAFRSASWSDKHERVSEPTPIPLPCRAEAISVGRCHMLILDEDNLIWEMRDWGRAYHHTSPSLTAPSNPGSTRRPHHIVQLSTGWSHSSCLTSTGKIYVWFPFSPAYNAALTVAEEMNGPLGVRGDGDQSRAVKWGTVKGDVVDLLEDIPERPKWDDLDDGDIKEELMQKEKEWEEVRHGMNESQIQRAEKVIKIASGQGFIVALRGNGEVWIRQIHESRESEWEYLPYFSSPAITHISAQFTSLTSYSTLPPSKVNHARLPSSTAIGFGTSFHPDSLPSLQGKGVIQVAIGDYHYAALTSQGEMWTWGQGSAGQLGLGEVGTTGGQVDSPRKVDFDNYSTGDEEKPFVFAITASGWHTGALVLGPQYRKEKPSQAAETTAGQSTTEETLDMPGAFPTPERSRSTQIQTTSAPSTRPGNALPMGIGMPQFRIGLAGGFGAGRKAGLEPQLESQAGGSDQRGDQEIPMPDPGQGGRPERNWLRTSRGNLGGAARPAPGGSDI